MDILHIDHLSKSFGMRNVIDDLTFQVPEHSIFGFIGQNGAGKTTTMKMIVGLLAADSGTITVCGEPVRYGQTKTNRHIGYLPDVPEFYHYMKPYEYLKLCGKITGMSTKDIKIKSDELLTMVGLDKTNKRIAGFSRGMKQRLGIAQALLNEPKLLICDEPTSALDPIGRKEILDILRKTKDKTTVLFSTHILSDVERICDHIALLHDGKLALSGSLSQIRAQRKQDKLRIEFVSPSDTKRFIDVTHVQYVVESEVSLIVHSTSMGKTQLEIMRMLSDMHIAPLTLEIMESTLESLFMEVVQ